MRRFSKSEANLSPQTNMKRRKFLKRAAILSGAGGLTGLYAWQIEPFWVEFVQMKMHISHLPAAFVGKTIMQFSDLHIGNRFDRQFIIESFEKAKVFQPDIVVYTGDFVSYESSEQLEQLAEVFQHAVIGKLATIGVLGNHDYGRSWRQPEVAERIVSILKENGVHILRNELFKINDFNIIGLDDYWGTNFDDTILKMPDSFNAHLALFHNPDVVDLPIWKHFRGWILSGHTHGGQVKPPFLPPPMLPVKNKRYTAGKFELGAGKTLYINRALGHLWQIRLNVRPEITLFTLI